MWCAITQLFLKFFSVQRKKKPKLEAIVTGYGNKLNNFVAKLERYMDLQYLDQEKV
jgi:hypothetical protein